VLPLVGMKSNERDLDWSSLRPSMPRWRELKQTRIVRRDLKRGSATATFDEWFCHDFRTWSFMRLSMTSFTFGRSRIPAESPTTGKRVGGINKNLESRKVMPHGSTKQIFNIKIAPGEKADLVKFMTEGLSSPDYPDHKAPELPK